MFDRCRKWTYLWCKTNVSRQRRGGQEWAFLNFWRQIITLASGTLFKRLRELTHRASVPAVVVPVSCPYILWWWITTLLRHSDGDDAKDVAHSQEKRFRKKINCPVAFRLFVYGGLSDVLSFFYFITFCNLLGFGFLSVYGPVPCYVMFIAVISIYIDFYITLILCDLWLLIISASL